MKNLSIRTAIAGGTALLIHATVFAYPLDGGDESGIRRLQGYLLEQDNPKAAKLAPGQLWSADEIRLKLVGYDGPDFDELPQDPDLTAFLTENFRRRDSSYSMAILDMSNPENLRWAGLRPDLRQNAGSVGKLLCMTALFHALAEAFPDVGD